MELLMWKECNDTQKRIFKLTLTNHDMLDAYGKADSFFFRLLRECEESKSVADKLLALEAICRKIEEARQIHADKI